MCASIKLILHDMFSAIPFYTNSSSPYHRLQTKPYHTICCITYHSINILKIVWLQKAEKRKSRFIKIKRDNVSRRTSCCDAHIRCRFPWPSLPPGPPPTRSADTSSDQCQALKYCSTKSRKTLSVKHSCDFKWWTNCYIIQKILSSNPPTVWYVIKR